MLLPVNRHMAYHQVCMHCQIPFIAEFETLKEKDFMHPNYCVSCKRYSYEMAHREWIQMGTNSTNFPFELNLNINISNYSSTASVEPTLESPWQRAVKTGYIESVEYNDWPTIIAIWTPLVRTYY